MRQDGNDALQWIALNQKRKSMLKAIALLAAIAGATPALAAVETYQIDPEHTYPSFEFSHMGISIWRGKFDRTHGRITLDRAARTGTVDVVVDVDSIDFGLDKMHTEARGENFFDVARHPTATYKGTVRFAGDQPASIDGQVTIMGVSRPVPLKINLFQCMPHPMLKKEVCGADAEGEINWSQYGMKMSKYGEGDAGKVRLRIQVEALKIEAAKENS
jgi:polyisoprenoid-binding protein YceI